MIRAALAAVLALLVIELTSCTGGTTAVVSDGDPYWGTPVYGYDLNYFYGAPVVYGAWGGWGPGYFVGPPRWGAGPPRPVPRGGVGPRPGFRPAGPGRPTPSIPRGPRGPGMRGSPVRR